MRQTPPARPSLRAAPFPPPRAGKLSARLSGGRAGRWHCPWNCWGISLGVSFPERTCVCSCPGRMRGSMHECVLLLLCEFPCPSLLARFRLRYTECGPLPHPNPVSQDAQSSLQNQDAQEPEFLHRVCPTTHPASPAPLLPLRPVSCSSVPTCSPRQNSDSPALPGSALPAPGSWLPPGRTWRSGAGRGG